MSDTTTENDNRNPFTRPGFILSAALIVALIAAVLVIAFLPRNGNDEAAPSTPATSASTPTPEPSSTQQAAGDGSVCGLPESEETALGSAPETEWELTGRIAVPTASTTIGPGLVNDAGVRSCFAHSPSGALFAAANIFGLVSSGNQQAVLQELAADSPARNQELEQLETGASSATQAQIKGFQLQNYTQLAATVDLGIELSSGAVGSVPIPLIWEGGDWKLNVTEGGIAGSQQLTDLSAYIPWSGV